MRIGRNEPCPCGSGMKYKKCCLSREMEMNALTGESLPVYKCWISLPEGSRIAVISRIKPNRNYEMVSILVDEWKMGLKDAFGNFNMPKEQLDEYIRGGDFREADIDECKKLIKRGILIAKGLGLGLPKEYGQCKGIAGNIESIEISGSLYKCYACGENDLSEETISLIKEVTLKDVRKGVCGTPQETELYFTCEDCKGKNSWEANTGDHEDGTTEDNIWSKGYFAETLSPSEIKEKEKTIHMGHGEDMRFNCKKCKAKISAHNRDWHNGMCDECFNKEYHPDD
ncbi:MAG: SEC-C metal-binding domain-containing protein [archaeon]